MSNPNSNRGFTQVESLITPPQLRARYLFGIGIKDNAGNELSDETLQTYINTAVSMLEHYLDIAIMPRCETEEKDYNANEYYDWGYFQLNKYPVLSITTMQVVYTKDNNGANEVVLDIPQSWIRLVKESGIIRLIPNNKFPGTLQTDSAGAFFPELFRRHSKVPNLWVINYKHGFEDGKIPVLINTAIGLTASLFALSIAGNLVLQAGIASQSISLDGLSQSIATTQSAEFSGYSATRGEYNKQLYGQREGDPSAILTILKDYYKGSAINII